MIVRLARVSVLRNTQREEQVARERDESLRELRALRQDVVALAGDDVREQIAARFSSARFPFRHDRIVPRIVVRGSTEGAGLEPGFRTQPRWSDEEKRVLVRRGWELADAELNAIEVDGGPPAYTAGSGT
jgi:hypothetical protein